MSSTNKLLIIAALACALSGCSSWSDLTWSDDALTDSVQLGRSRMSSDSVVLEVTHARLEHDQHELADEIWQEVDEQHLADNLHWLLDKNGLRCGVVGSPLPVGLRQVLSDATSELPSEIDLQTPGGSSSSPHRMQSRTGRPGKILVGEGVQELVSLLVWETDHVVGRSFAQGQCQFQVKTFPLGDGRVRIELVPEVEYGDTRPGYVGHQGTWKFQAGRENHTLDQMRIEAVLSPGQSLLLGSTPQPKGLGRTFFAYDAPQNRRQTMLLIRLLQTQRDDLFETDESEAPVVSPAD